MRHTKSDEAFIAAIKVTPLEDRAITVLFEREPCTIRELAFRLDVTLEEAHAVVSALMLRGLVEAGRWPRDPYALSDPVYRLSVQDEPWPG